MSRRVSAFLVALIGLLPATLAQSPLYGQCGGQGWTGATTCASGSVCTYSNPYYSQCLPGTASSTTPATTNTAPSSTPTSNNGKPAYWFSFGDSYTQTGFSSSGALPSTSNPMGNPGYPGNTDTGGPNWVVYVTETYNNSLVFTYNYAYGGATIDRNIVPPYTASVQTLTDQVNTFLNTVANKPSSTPWTSSNTLFSVFIGINDIGGSYGNGGDRSAFSDTLLNAYFALVQKLYNVGGRNFLFVNVPPVDRSPLNLANSAASQALEKSVIDTYNSKLLAKVSAFQSANSGVKTFFWDSNAQFTTMLNNPTAYGFKDATSYGTASNEFWGNNYHPSSYAHKFFGQTVGKTVLANTIW